MPCKRVHPLILQDRRGFNASQELGRVQVIEENLYNAIKATYNGGLLCVYIVACVECFEVKWGCRYNVFNFIVFAFQIMLCI